MQNFLSIIHPQNASSNSFGNRRSPFFKPAFQSKPAIGQPPYKEKADTVDNTDREINDRPIQPKSFFLIQRKCDHCEEQERKVQRRKKDGKEMIPDSGLENYIDNLQGSGRPLPEEV